MKAIILGFFLFCQLSHAFLPPVGPTLKEIFDGRKRSEGVELIFLHRLAPPNGEPTEIEERVMSTGGRSLFFWKSSSMTIPFTGSLEKKVYRFVDERKIASQSSLFLKYFTAQTPEEYRDYLLAERFVRREQFRQFKEGFAPVGDPQTWDIKGNYLDHEGISLARTPSGVAVAVKGFESAGQKRTIFFDKGLLGILRLEWVEGGESSSWNFGEFSKMAAPGLYPKKINFMKGDLQIINSELVLVKPLKAKQVNEFTKTWQKSGRGEALTSSFEAGLKLLLSHR